MTRITVWVQQLVLLVLVVSFLELMAPQNALRRYVQLVSGLLVLVAVLNPLVGLVRGGGWLTDALQTATDRTQAGSLPSDRSARDLAAANQQLQLDLFTDRLRAYLESELEKATGERVGVAVRTSGEGVVQQVTVTAARGSAQVLRERVADLAGIPLNRVLIVEEAMP